MGTGSGLTTRPAQNVWYVHVLIRPITHASYIIKADSLFCNLMQAAGRDEGQSLDGASPCEIIAPFVLFGRLVYEVVECEGGLPDEATVVARSRCHDNHEPESWNLETAAHVRPRHQH